MVNIKSNKIGINHLNEISDEEHPNILLYHFVEIIILYNNVIIVKHKNTIIAVIKLLL